MRVDVPVMDSVAFKTKVLASKLCKQLRLATWNVSGLCSERKQREIADLLACNSIDIVAVQESWEKELKWPPLPVPYEQKNALALQQSSFRENPTYFLTSVRRWVCELVFDATMTGEASSRITDR